LTQHKNKTITSHAMPIPLSKRCLKVAERLFEEPRRSEVIRRLLNEASEKLPFCEKRKPDDMDQIRFSIMKLIAEPKSEDDIFKLAKEDCRDVIFAAGFANELRNHQNWYESLLGGENIEKRTQKSWRAFWRKS